MCWSWVWLERERSTNGSTAASAPSGRGALGARAVTRVAAHVRNRFQQQQALKGNLSKWVRDCLRDYPSYEACLQSLAAFFLRHGDQRQQDSPLTAPLNLGPQGSAANAGRLAGIAALVSQTQESRPQEGCGVGESSRERSQGAAPHQAASHEAAAHQAAPHEARVNDHGASSTHLRAGDRAGRRVHQAAASLLDALDRDTCCSCPSPALSAAAAVTRKGAAAADGGRAGGDSSGGWTKRRGRASWWLAG